MLNKTKLEDMISIMESLHKYVPGRLHTTSVTPEPGETFDLTGTVCYKILSSLSDVSTRDELGLEDDLWLSNDEARYDKFHHLIYRNSWLKPLLTWKSPLALPGK